MRGFENIDPLYPTATQDEVLTPTPLYSPEETKRIHHEDRHLIEVLETLVPELDQAYDDLGQTFEVFVEKYMLPRIEEKLEKLAKEDEKFSKGREELGVRMEPRPGTVFEEAEDNEKGGEDSEETDVDKDASDGRDRGEGIEEKGGVTSEDEYFECED